MKCYLVNTVLAVPGGKRELSVMLVAENSDQATSIAGQMLANAVRRPYRVLHAWCVELSTEYLEELTGRVRAAQAEEAALLAPWVAAINEVDGGTD